MVFHPSRGDQIIAMKHRRFPHALLTGMPEPKRRGRTVVEQANQNRVSRHVVEKFASGFGQASDMTLAHSAYARTRIFCQKPWSTVSALVVSICSRSHTSSICRIIRTIYSFTHFLPWFSRASLRRLPLSIIESGPRKDAYFIGPSRCMPGRIASFPTTAL